MRRGTRSLPFLGLLFILIPLLACSPRPLFRFVRSLVATPAKSPQGDSILARAKSPLKSAFSQAVPVRSYRPRQDSNIAGAPPFWPWPHSQVLASLVPPLGVMDQGVEQSKRELA